MHALIVLAHPEAGSLTGAVARRIASDLGAAGWTAEVADLAAEGFDPRFTTEDLEAYRTAGAVPADARREQERIERADALVLVFPVYWWGPPALLRGWIERVFARNWAYEVATGRSALAGLGSHAVAISGTGADDPGQPGLDEALKLVLGEGTFGFCDAELSSCRIVHDSEASAPGAEAGIAAAVVADLTGA